jgi:hypothetical protein
MLPNNERTKEKKKKEYTELNIKTRNSGTSLALAAS